MSAADDFLRESTGSSAVVPQSLADQFAADAVGTNGGYTGDPDLPIAMDTDVGLANNFRAFGHNFMKPFHNIAMSAENALQWGANKLPSNPVSDYINTTVNSDREVLAQQEAQYQKDVPTNAGTTAGAVAGTVAPWVGGGAALLSKGGEAAASLLPESTWPIVRSMVSGGAQGALASPAVTPGQSENYGTDLFRNAGLGAAIGAAIPVAGAAVKGIYNQATGLLKPIFAPRMAAETSLAPLAQKTLDASYAIPAGSAGTQTMPPIQQRGFQMIQQQSPVAEEATQGNLGALAPGGVGAPYNDPVPGVKPTALQTYGGVDLAGAEKAIRSDPEGGQIFKVVDANNNGARWNYLNGYTDSHSPNALQQLKDAREAATAPVRAQVFQNPVDVEPVISSLNDLGNSGLGQRGAIPGATKSFIDDINKGMDITKATVPDAPPGYIRPDLLDAYRQNVRDYIARNATNGIVGSQEQAAFMPVKDAITSAIEGANPGYSDYLAQYGALSRPINDMEAANSIRDYFANRPFTATGQPQLTLSGFNTALKRAQNVDYGLSPDFNAAMGNIQDSLQHETLSNSLREAGSDTAWKLRAPSWLAQKVMGTDLESGAAAHVPFVRNWSQGAAGRVNTQWANILADPQSFAALAGKSAQPNVSSQNTAIAAILRGMQGNQ